MENYKGEQVSSIEAQERMEVFRQPKILVIEDEFQKEAEEGLKTIGEIKIVGALEDINVLEGSWTPDIVISDVHIPKEQGGIVQKLKKEELENLLQKKFNKIPGEELPFLFYTSQFHGKGKDGKQQVIGGGIGASPGEATYMVSMLEDIYGRDAKEKYGNIADKSNPENWKRILELAPVFSYWSAGYPFIAKVLPLLPKNIQNKIAETTKFFNPQLGSSIERILKYRGGAEDAFDAVLSWAEKDGVEIHSISKLGGGFTNAVFLVESHGAPVNVSGLPIAVAKVFPSVEEAKRTQKAQTTLQQIGESSFPKFTWAGERMLLSEKAEGVSLRVLFRHEQEERQFTQTKEALKALGNMLGSFHKRSKKDFDRKTASKEFCEEIDIHKKRIVDYITQFQEESLFDFLKKDASFLLSRIESIADDDTVSCIHGDAHLDQFFWSSDKSLITIIDYDEVSFGEPEVDIARAHSSIRYWSRKFDIPDDKENMLIDQFMQGYKGSIYPSKSGEKAELFNQEKVLLYRLRLPFIYLSRWFKNPLRNEIQKVFGGAKEEKELFERYIFQEPKLRSADEKTLIEKGFRQKDIEQLEGALHYYKEAHAIIDTLLDRKKL